jgi:hypothetical protein
MMISVQKTKTPLPRCQEGDLFLDEDGDLNIVVAATHLRGIKDEDLVLCCVHRDAAWIRGLADQDHLAGLRRLSPGETVTLTVE